MNVKSLCKNCGKPAPAESFKLHYQYKMMVCPECYSGRTEQKKQQVEREQKKEPAKPAGWDKEDEYLERMSRLKRDETQAQFTKIPGTDSVTCRCTSCKYQFKYNPFKKMPRNCPYCNVEVPRLKEFNLL